MIPLWKIQREISRIGQQVIALPGRLASLPMRLSEPRRRAEFERDFDRLTRLTQGDLPLQKRIAIFLIFQPQEMAPSVVSTCRWLAANGYSPFVVSNGALTEASRNLIAKDCWRLLERPNFGYDFGGYRDAILLVLSRWATAPERLIVMNDSMWTPMVPDLMARLETAAADADIVGLLQDEKVSHDTRGGQPTDRRHLESYFYLFTSTALAHPQFLAFWQAYRMTDYKPHTIKFGELRFSGVMQEAGLRLAALTKRSVFLDRLALMDDTFLALTLRYGSYADRDIARAAARLAQRTIAEPGWRDAALNHIRRAANRKRFNASFPHANDHVFGTLFMKKSREPIFVAMRRNYLLALDAGHVQAPPRDIEAEIRALESPVGQGA